MFERTPLIPLLLALVGALGSVSTSHAQVRSATVAVEGMSCPFCAFGVEKRLRKVAGVESVAVRARDGIAALDAKEGESIAVGEIPAAVERAGFTPGAITVDAEGSVTADEPDRVLLHVGGSAQTFELAAREASAVERLRSFAARGALVKIHGPLHPRADGLAALSVETIEEVPNG